MSLHVTYLVADAANPVFPVLRIGDPTAGSAGDPNFRDFLGQIVNKLWTLFTDNLALCIAVVLLFLCLQFGETLYLWVRSGFGKWDDHGQGRLF